MVKTARLNLTERVTASLKNLNNYPWLPHLTNELVKARWQALESDINLTNLNYGTARVLVGDANAPRNYVMHLSTQLGVDDCRATIPIEVLPRDIVLPYEEMGVSFYTTDEITKTNVLSCLENAFYVLKQVPTLLTTVVAWVRSLHLLKPELDDYDVSFSEPHVPFSIFVSIPSENTNINAMRVAEAILHEAMHLQLTFIEEIVPVVLSSTIKYFSPWKQEERSAQGIVHAVYVFRVIDKFLEITSSLARCTKEEMAYLHTRRYDISEKINQVQMFIDCPDLTPTGHDFVRQLLLK